MRTAAGCSAGHAQYNSRVAWRQVVADVEVQCHDQEADHDLVTDARTQKLRVAEVLGGAVLQSSNGQARVRCR